MRNKNKILSGILALSAVACVSLGIAFQSDDAVNASAADSTMSVNTLGYLEWAQVDGATSYQVSSNYGTFTVEENRANVGDAITKAAKAANAQDATATSTTVDFTVTPYTGNVAGEASTYTHTVESYIDYAYATYDIAQMQTDTNGAILADSTLERTNGTTGGVGVTYKNSLLTFAWKSNIKNSTAAVQNSYFYLFGDETKSYSTTYFASAKYAYYAWGIQFSRTNYNIILNGTTLSASQATTDKKTTTIDTMTVPEHMVDNTYAFTMGVFDTYGLDGKKIGETLYVLREIMDSTNGTKMFDFQDFTFVDNNTLADPNNDGEYDDAITDDDYTNMTGFGMRAPDTNHTYTLSTGEVSENENAPLYQAKNLSLSLNGDIGVNMYADLNDVAKLNTNVAQMQITYKGETTTQVVPTAETAGAMAGYYKFSYAVAPKEIDEVITARLVIPGGPIGEEVSYTVRDWVNSVKSAYETDNATYEKDYAMATALENYCDTAVNYFDTTADQPEKNDTVVDFSEFAPTSTAWSGKVTLAGISLIAEANTMLRIYFKVDGEMPVVKVNEQEVEVQTLEQGEDTFYYVEMTDIAAKDLDTAYTFEFGEDNVSCSALTYGCTLTESSDAKSVNLVKALYAYNQVANTYFAQ